MLIASTPMGLTHVLADRDIPEMGSTAQVSRGENKPVYLDH